MIRRFTRPRAAGLVTFVLAMLVSPVVIAPAAQAADPYTPVEQEYLVNGGRTSPQGVAVGPDGNVWIAQVDGHAITRMTPAGVFTSFRTLDSSPQFITAGPDGNMWFTESSNYGQCDCTTAGHIGRITMSGQLTEFPVPTPFNDPYAITVGGDGNVWFSEDGSKIGKITPSGQITEYPIPTQQGLPDDIALGPDGNVWFGESLADKVASITPSGQVTEYDLPEGSGPEGLVTGPDHNLWIVEGGSNNIARLNVKSRALTEFPIPHASSNSQLITVGPDGNLWFTEARVDPSGAGFIGRISPTGVVTEFTVPAPRRGFDEPFDIVAGPGGKMWFTEELGGELVSLDIPTGVAGTQAAATTSTVTRSAPQPPPIREVALPESTLVSPFAITEGSDGNMWFTESYKHQIGRINRDGTITEFPASTGSQGITSGPDGALWYCNAESDSIVRLTTTGQETDYPLQAPYGCYYTTLGADGNIWYSGYQVFGRLTPSGVDTEFDVSVDGPMIKGPDGNLWASSTPDFAQDADILRIAPDGTATAYPVSGFSPYVNTNTFTFGPDGNLWMSGITTSPNPTGFTSVVAKFDLTTHAAVTFHAKPGPANSWAGITTGPDGALWYDFGGNGNGPAGISRFDTSGQLLGTELFPAGFGTPTSIAVGHWPGDKGKANDAVWVVESQINRFAVMKSGDILSGTGNLNPGSQGAHALTRQSARKS